jgi:hypothetical protein
MERASIAEKARKRVATPGLTIANVLPDPGFNVHYSGCRGCTGGGEISGFRTSGSAGIAGVIYGQFGGLVNSLIVALQ